MARKIDELADIIDLTEIDQPVRFLVFVGSLWVGETYEHHDDILKQSAEDITAVITAGFLKIASEGSIEVSSSGSHALEIPQSDNALIAEFLRSLSDFGDRDITEL
jgi:hypothetical protein